jgi:hypothetical protein
VKACLNVKLFPLAFTPGLTVPGKRHLGLACLLNADHRGPHKAGEYEWTDS